MLAVFLISMGIGQLISTWQSWRAASLTGRYRTAGYGLGLALLLTGAWLLPDMWSAMAWALLTSPLALMVLLIAGSYFDPPPHPDRLFSPNHPAHNGCIPVNIPDGDNPIPALLLTPKNPTGLAVCLTPGAGDHKTMFKWRLVESLLTEGLTVLTIDPPGHGNNRQQPMHYPNCLSVIVAAIEFLGQQPGIRAVGAAGISLGGALTLAGLSKNKKVAEQVKALAVLETPIELNYTRRLHYGELWQTLRAPVLSLLREVSIRQMWQIWRSGGYLSRHSTPELFSLLTPVATISQLADIPILLVYSQSDRIAPPTHAEAMQRAAPWATMLTSRRASHVTLTLLPDVNRQIARWLWSQLNAQPVNDESSHRA